MASRKEPGLSGNTPIKQDHLAIILKGHIAIVRAILKKHHWAWSRYVYFDLTAGPGVDMQEQEGSPLIFVKTVSLAQIPSLAICIEKELETYTRLCACCDRVLSLAPNWMKDSPRYIYPVSNSDGEMELYYGEAENILQNIVMPQMVESGGKPSTVYGLTYYDPNGNFEKGLSLLQHLARSYPHMDILCHISATTVKRCFYSSKHPQDKRLHELMDDISKKHWLIRDPYGHQEWTFLLGTNWNKMPEYPKIGLYDIQGPKGRQILEGLSSRQADVKSLEKKQVMMLPTVPIASILNIQGSLSLEPK